MKTTIHTYICFTSLWIVRDYLGEPVPEPIWILLKHWHQLGHMQICTSSQTDNHARIPPRSFLQAECPSCRPTNSIKALLFKMKTTNYMKINSPCKMPAKQIPLYRSTTINTVKGDRGCAKRLLGA